MFQQKILAVSAVALISASLAGTANALPSTARGGTTTVTGTYKPLDLHLSLDSGIFDYQGANTFSFSGDFTGTFDGVGYTASGPAGTWKLDLGFTTFNTSNYFVDAGNDVHDGSASDTITLYADDNDVVVGTLVYQGGLSATTGALQPGDTPISGDVFELHAVGNSGTPVPIFQVVCHDGVSTCNDFDVELLQDLTQLGPFVVCGEGEECYYKLDIGEEGVSPNRVNQECVDTVNGGYKPCGSVPITGFRISSVPEPGTLALLGLGLVGLGLGRRARA